MDELVVEKVLRAAECVPPGAVATYGDLARLAGTGPRQVGAIMARFGGSAPWWRVVSARGLLPQPLAERARPHWEEEGISLLPGGAGVRLSANAADASEMAARFQAAIADLPPAAGGR